MRKTLLASFALLGGFAATAAAHELPIGPPDGFTPPPPDCRQLPPMPPADHHWRPPKTQLSAAQQAQLDQLLQKEHDYVAGLLKNLDESRQALRLAADREPFDEAVVTALAKQQADIQAELMLSHIKTKVRIRALSQQTPHN